MGELHRLQTALPVKLEGVNLQENSPTKRQRDRVSEASHLKKV